MQNAKIFCYFDYKPTENEPNTYKFDIFMTMTILL